MGSEEIRVAPLSKRAAVVNRMIMMKISGDERRCWRHTGKDMTVA
jgi:hypothetical protein